MPKPKLLPAPKDAALPESHDGYYRVGSLYVYRLGDQCEAWKVTKRKQELMGKGWLTSGKRWGLFCVRVEPARLVCVVDYLDDAAIRFDAMY